MFEKHTPLSVPSLELRPSPICHESLTLEQQKLARHIYESCGHFYYSSFEQWETEFLRDVHPNQELLLWHAIAQSFARLRSLYPETEPRQLLGQVVRCATGSDSTKYPEITDIYAAVCNEIATKRNGLEQWFLPKIATPIQ